MRIRLIASALSSTTTTWNAQHQNIVVQQPQNNKINHMFPLLDPSATKRDVSRFVTINT
jgi:hypothetical protein